MRNCVDDKLNFLAIKTAFYNKFGYNRNIAKIREINIFMNYSFLNLGEMEELQFKIKNIKFDLYDKMNIKESFEVI